MALFAALSYAVTQSTRGGGSGIDSERTELVGAQIAQNGQAFATAIQRMQIIHSCGFTDLSFENSFVSGYTNAGAPADKSCHLFDPAGAGLSWLKPPSGANDGSDWYFTADDRVVGVGTDCGTGSCTELVAILPNLSLDLCIAINDSLGVNNPGGAPPVDMAQHGTALFDGTIPPFPKLLDDTLGNLDGHYSACYKHAVDYYYYQVLVAQ